MTFSFLGRENLGEHARHLSLTAYAPKLELGELTTGIDNLRHDVFLSPQFVAAARNYIAHLIAKYGAVEDIAVAPVEQGVTSALRVGRVADSPRLAAAQRTQDKPTEGAEFKRQFTDLLVAGLNHAKAQGNSSLDLLLRAATLKFLRLELGIQFNRVLERCREKLKGYEGPRQAIAAKGVELRERVAAFQVSKKQVLRRTGQEIFQTLREIEKETLLRMRRALFGEVDGAVYSQVLLNRLTFTEDGRDDYVNAEHYVMTGNFDRDADRFLTLQEIARNFLTSLELAPAAGADHVAIDYLLNVPDNAQELVAGGMPDESTEKGLAQRAILNAWIETLENHEVMENIIAAYEAASLLGEYSPPIHAQQLKSSLVSKVERQRVEKLLEEHGRISPDNLKAAVKRVGNTKGPERAKVAGRFLRDFIRYHRDLRCLEVLNGVLETINLISNEKLRELSAINRTLYEFLLPSEQKPAEDKVAHHVVLKADIRDSTTLTRTLFERGLNPASYFSLNFYDPVNKLLQKYQASKVFIEGDAVILALFGHEGVPSFAVARACVLAREMVDIVRAYNDASGKAGLPTLELGLGISFQDSEPMYLMDGSQRIMISKALNESDRLSSCNKGARRFVAEKQTVFNVYSFKTVHDEDTGGNPDEFLMRYNVGGVNMSEAAFRQLQQEISLQQHDVRLPTLYKQESVRLFSGLAPIGGDVFRRVIVREGTVASIDAASFSFKEWTDRRYYEVCTSSAVYDYVEANFKAAEVPAD